MTTRAQIRAKYGIEQLEHPDIADRTLSPSEAESYEKYVWASGKRLSIGMMMLIGRIWII